jgi:hypothetical protein
VIAGTETGTPKCLNAECWVIQATGDVKCHSAGGPAPPPEISHSLTAASPAEARVRPSAENATERIQPL